MFTFYGVTLRVERGWSISPGLYIGGISVATPRKVTLRAGLLIALQYESLPIASAHTRIIRPYHPLKLATLGRELAMTLKYRKKNP